MGPSSTQVGANERRRPREDFPASTCVSESAATPGISSDSEPDIVKEAKKKLAREMKARKEKKEASKKSSKAEGKTTGKSSATVAERDKLKKQLKDHGGKDKPDSKSKEKKKKKVIKISFTLKKKII